MSSNTGALRGQALHEPAETRKIKSRKVRPGSGDFMIVALVSALVMFGIIMVFSSGYYNSIMDSGSSPYSYLIKEAIFAGIGFAAMFFLMAFDYHILGKMGWMLVAIAEVLIVLTYTPLGRSYNNAARWLPLPGGVGFIPSEAAKLACIIFLAAYLAARPDRINRPVTGLLPPLAVIAVIVLSVYLQPSTTSAATILIICIGIIFIAGVKLRYVFIAFAAGVAAFGMHIVMEAGEGGSYKMSRLTSFLDPFADAGNTGYQVVHGIYALASGGFFGSGIGNGVEKALYLPDPMNDFILATIGEELGMLGIMLLIFAYILLIWRCIRTAMRASDLLGTLIASGVAFMLSFQVVLNFMVVLSLAPPTGITLPFISYGGTALIIFMAAMGIVINISRHLKPVDSSEE